MPMHGGLSGGKVFYEKEGGWGITLDTDREVLGRLPFSGSELWRERESQPGKEDGGRRGPGRGNSMENGLSGRKGRGVCAGCRSGVGAGAKER